MNIFQYKVLPAFVFFLVSAFLNSVAQPMELERRMFEKDTRPYAKIWIDKPEGLHYGEVLKKLRSGEFRISDSLHTPGFFERGAYVYWIALIVKNKEHEIFPMLVYNTRLSEDSTWHLRENMPPEIKKLSKYGERDPGGYVPFPLRWSWIYPIKPYATDTILIKYYNFKAKYNFTPNVSDATFYAGKSMMLRVQQHWPFIFAIGALFSMTVMAICLWLYVRELAFFWYGAFCFSLFLTTLWNFESEIPALYFLSNYFEWTHTKVYIHTVLSGVCHSMFLYYFFRRQSTVIEKLVKAFLWICLGAVIIETTLLVTERLHWSWVFYFGFRVFVMIYGIFSLYFIRKIPGRQSKWIIAGALGIYLFDMISNFWPQYSSLITLTGLVVDIFCFTVATASRFNQIQIEKYDLILEQQKREMEGKIEMERLRISISQDLRNDIASDLHDDVGTALSSISFLGEMASLQLDKKNTDVRPILDRITHQSREMIQTMRGVVWVINPQNDSFIDFFEKIHSFAEVVLQSRLIDLSYSLTKPEEDFTLPLDVQRNLFLICKEIIVNTAKHSKASQASIRISRAENIISIEIEDNGIGFCPEQKYEGNGLKNLQNRTRQIGGNLNIRSESNQGTLATIIIPINRAVENAFTPTL